MRHLLLALGALALLTTACSTPEESETTATGALTLEEEGANGQAETTHLGDSALLPWFEPPSRARQRLNIDQLSSSIERLTGGHNWMDGDDVLWDTLSATLGKPDFEQITQEDLLPSTLFHKFLDDASRQVCAAVIEAEVNGTASEPHLMVHVDPAAPLESPEAIDDNLPHLILAFHGKRLSSDAPELIHWRWLVDTVGATASEPSEAWNAVCVALFTHPRFYSY